MRSVYYLILFSSILTFFGSCSKKPKEKHTHSVERIVEEKPIEVEKIIEIEKVQDLEGVFYFDLGGQIEFIADVEDKIHIVTAGQSIQSVNPANDTIGSHPIISGSDLPIVDGAIRFHKNVNYKSNTHDIEKDVGGDIDGTKRTDYIIEMLESGRIRLTIKIYDNKINTNVNFIVAERVLESLWDY